LSSITSIQKPEIEKVEVREHQVSRREVSWLAELNSIVMPFPNRDSPMGTASALNLLASVLVVTPIFGLLGSYLGRGASTTDAHLGYLFLRLFGERLVAEDRNNKGPVR